MCSVRFPYAFFEELSSGIDELEPFGVDTPSMHRVVETAKNVLFRTMEAASFAMRELGSGLKRIALRSEVDINDTRIPDIMKNCLLNMYPGSSLDASFGSSFSFDSVFSQTAIPPRAAPSRLQCSSSSSSCSRPKAGSDRPPFMEELKLDEANPPLSDSQGDTIPYEISGDDRRDLAVAIKWWSMAVEKLKSSIDSVDGGKPTEIHKKMAEIIQRYVKGCCRELEALLDPNQSKMLQERQALFSHSAPPQNARPSHNGRVDNGDVQANDAQITDLESFLLNEDISK